MLLADVDVAVDVCGGLGDVHAFFHERRVERTAGLGVVGRGTGT